MSLEKQQNSKPKTNPERNRIVDVIVSTATLAFLATFLYKCADDFDNEPRIPLKDKQKLETAIDHNTDLITGLANLRKDYIIFEDQIYARLQFYKAPGLKHEIIYKT